MKKLAFAAPMIVGLILTFFFGAMMMNDGPEPDEEFMLEQNREKCRYLNESAEFKCPYTGAQIFDEGAIGYGLLMFLSGVVTVVAAVDFSDRMRYEDD